MLRPVTAVSTSKESLMSPVVLPAAASQVEMQSSHVFDLQVRGVIECTPDHKTSWPRLVGANLSPFAEIGNLENHEAGGQANEHP